MGVISDTEWCAYDYPGHGGKLPGSALSPNDSTAAIVLQVELRFNETDPVVMEDPWRFRSRYSFKVSDVPPYVAYPTNS